MNSDQWSLAEDPGQKPLSSGVQIGPYRIEVLLGEGGMGTVYRAVDTKLNRPVAVKFLSDALADAAARRRFQREAQMASSLNHPHIVTVYDVGEFEERQYIVTEFIDGGTLKDWAKSEKRTWRQCVELLTGVADGLAAAHAAGILHRDIKPANILVAKNGYAKLADFGLAKLSEEKPPSLVSGDTLTMAEAETRPGVIVGTVAYMSPEQAAGRSLDARSDIFSFGVLLYEQLAGRRPFGGASELEVLKTVIQGTPEPISSDIPQPLRTTVEKAIEKDPAERYQTMRDVVVDLRRVTRKAAEAPPVVAASKPSRAWAPRVMAVVAIAGVAAGLWLALRPAAVPDNPLAGARFTRLTDYPGDEGGAALSPDGKFVVFVSDRDGHRDAWVGQVGTNSFQNLTKGAFTGVPRGRNVGFNSDGTQIWIGGPPPVTNRLALIPLVGGAPRPFLDEKAGALEWSRDGKRLVYMRNPPGDPLYVADADGSNPRQLFVDQEGLHNHQPTWSPDGRWIYFTHGQVVNCQFDMWRIPAAGGTPEQLTNQSGCMACPTPIDAHTVLYVSEDHSGGPWLWALDPERKTTRRISSGVERYSSIAASADGRRLVAAISNPVANLWSVPIRDRMADPGEIKPFALPTARALAPRFSQDALFYLSSLDGGDGLWRWKNDQAAEIWKGSESAISEVPAISPDGRQVAIVLTRSGKRNIRVIQADGSQARGFIETLDVRGTPAWSPDGKWIVAGGNDGNSDGLFKISLDGGAPLKLASGLAFNPVWSTSRPLIVYAGPNVAAEQDLLGVNPDGGKVDLPPMRTFGEGAMVRFTPDGSRLVYFGRSGTDFDFVLLDLATNNRRSLAHLDATLSVHSFDITPDGKQIVFDRIRQNSDVYLIDLPR